ncbi:hypothetical protein E4U59_000564, partial [Claviceps monticola]
MDELAPVSIAQVSGVLLLISFLESMTVSSELSVSSLDSSADASESWVAEWLFFPRRDFFREDWEE